MGEEQVEITVGPDGRVEVRVLGVPGMDCLAETEDLVRTLGGEVESQELTAEAYQDTEAEQDTEARQEGRLWH